MADRQLPTLPRPSRRRAVVIGSGSFGTAVSILLARGGMRTTLKTRTDEQAERLREARENQAYLPGIDLPRELRIEAGNEALERADFVLLAVPSNGLREVIDALAATDLASGAAVVSLAKGLAPPGGATPTEALGARFGAERVACVAGPAHAHEMVETGAALVAASESEELAETLASAFLRAGVVCERSNDPVGVELAGIAKNAAALAAGATEEQGLNAAGAAAGHIFAETWRLASARGARAESFIGLAGSGDLVATALAPRSRNRRAGELLGRGVPAADIPDEIGQAVEAFTTVPLLARALARADVQAPVTSALSRLIAGELPLDEWVAQVRATVPPPSRWARVGWWTRFWARVRGWFSRG